MLSEILKRVDIRLKAVNLPDATASDRAGLSKDAIRNMRRTIEAGHEKRGVSSTTLLALAPVLETSASWLLEEFGPEEMSPENSERFKSAVTLLASAPAAVQDRIIDFIEFETSRYAKSRETAT
jgi:hypothetical protein